jgi:undecaprenyl-diphosphatase
MLQNLFKFFLTVSFFGNWMFIVPVILIIFLALFIKKKQDYILPFIFTVAGAEIVTFFAKIIFHRPRPAAAMIFESDYSFPSGHATVAVTFYGYLAYILVNSVNKRYKYPIIITTIFLAALIGYSRLYLHVHYPSDVLGGYFVGAVFLIMGISLRKHSNLNQAR